MYTAKSIENKNSPLKIHRNSEYGFRYQDYDQLVLRNQQGYEIIPFHKITHLEASSNYCYIHLNDKSYRVQSKTLKYYESKLNESFLRVHHSYIVNLSFIQQYNVKMTSIVLIEKQEIPVSRSKKKDLLDILQA